MEAWHLGQVRAAGGAREAPQAGQNFCPTWVAAPHFGQAGPAAGAGAPTGVPQPGQKRVPGGISAPHFGQGVEGPPPYMPPIWPDIP